MLRYRS